MNFYKLWLKLEAIEGDINTIEGTFQEKIYNKMQSLQHNQRVEFALYCAKDCYNNTKNENFKSKAKICIDLTQQWLDDPKSVTTDQLAKAANDAYFSMNSFYALASAANAALVANVVARISNAASAANAARAASNSAAAYAAAQAADSAVMSFPRQHRTSKENEYLNIANSFTFKEKIVDSHYKKLSTLTNDPKQLNAALDYIEDNNIPLFIRDPDAKGMWYINFPGWESSTYGNKDLYKLKQDILTSELPFFERVRHYIKQIYLAKEIKQTPYQKYPQT